VNFDPVEFDFSSQDDPLDMEMSGFQSPQALTHPDVTAWSRLGEAPVKSAAADAELDFSFPDGPPDVEILGFRLSQIPILMERRTWSSLTAAILVHAILACQFWLLPKPPLASPKIIEVQLVSMPGEPGPWEGSPEPGKDEQPVAPAPTVTGPAAAPPVKKEPPDPRQHREKMATAATHPVQHKEIRPEQKSNPPQTESTPNQSEGSGQGEGTGAAGSPAGRGVEGKNGPGGTGLAERALGSPDGPCFLRKVLPSYPTLAKKLEKEGTVLLRVTIDERGRPVAVEVIEKAGFGFDEEAVKAVKDSTFIPAKIDGKPLACKALLPIRFVLKSS